MHLQSPVWCKIFCATSSTIVTFSTKSINSTFPKSICPLKHGQENYNLGCFGGKVACLNYFRKIDEESLKIILAMVWVLSVPSQQNQRYYTLEKKYQTISSKIVICIQGERWISQPFLGLENPSSPANKAFTSAFILKL